MVRFPPRLFIYRPAPWRPRIRQVKQKRNVRNAKERRAEQSISVKSARATVLDALWKSCDMILAYFR